jgi:hypothetical protein
MLIDYTIENKIVLLNYYGINSIVKFIDGSERKLSSLSPREINFIENIKNDKTGEWVIMWK